MNPTTSSKNIHIADDTSFDAQLRAADGPVLIEFSTRRCQPCKVLAPIIDQIADETAGRCRVISVDVDDSPRVSTRFGIRSVPTLIAFAGGAPRGQLVGIARRDAILKLIGIAPGTRAAV